MGSFLAAFILVKENPSIHQIKATRNDADKARIGGYIDAMSCAVVIASDSASGVRMI